MDNLQNSVCAPLNIIHWKYIPVIFFTVQKSIDKSSTMMTKLIIKLLLNQPHNKYVTMAKTRKTKWKNTANGCLKKKCVK